MKAKIQMPNGKCIESSPMLFLEGYQFIQNRCRIYKSDLFETRLLGKKVICMRGPEAAKLFYDNKRFKRKRATPKMIQKTLFGEYGVQGLDGEAHKHRKLMFMSIMSPQNMELLKTITNKQWKSSSRRWEQKDKVIFFDEVQEIMCQVACNWAGVPLQQNEIKLRANDLGKMIDAFGAVGPRYWQGKCARKRTETWIKELIGQIRTYKIKPNKESAAYIIAWHHNINGGLLSTQIAAVELINIIRPIVAIATYITFGALAMHDHPQCRKKLQSNNEAYPLMFVQEIRRYYPFAPFVGARVKKSFRWKNYNFSKGTLVLFDIYGTNHDPNTWERENEFLPERFGKWKENPFDFVPQGGGDTYNGHRCAGELVTINLMKENLIFLANHLEYTVPKQNLNFCLRRMPTLPRSRFIISRVRQRSK